MRSEIIKRFNSVVDEYIVIDIAHFRGARHQTAERTLMTKDLVRGCLTCSLSISWMWGRNTKLMAAV